MAEMAGRTFIIAEAGVNHNGDLGRARSSTWRRRPAPTR